VRLDTVFYYPGRMGAINDWFCIDLNDNLFVPGDTICYFIGAQSAGTGEWSYYHDRLHATDASSELVAGAPGMTGDINVAFANALEMTCLPTQHLTPGRGILYVDAADGRGVQPYFDSAFEMLAISGEVDRFDVTASGTSALGQFGLRVQNVLAQLIPAYDVIIWNSGTLDTRTIGDGMAPFSSGALKSDDWAVIRDFLDQHPDNPGVYLSGNGLASEWFGQVGGAAVATRSSYMQFNRLTDNHTTLAGMPLNPLGIADSLTMFWHAGSPDTILVNGGCPVVGRLDVIQETGGSTLAMSYENDLTRGAVLAQTSANLAASQARVVLSGFSYHLVGEYRPKGVPDRVEHLADILAWLGHGSGAPTAVATTPGVNTLAQNYPNPFNPSTTIEYGLRTRAHVALKIYSVSGHLVRVLVNEVRDAGGHQVRWDGTNNAGQQVASGVYFYRLQTAGFTQTKKMVLLK